MKGLAKLKRESDKKYHVYVKKWLWQRWKPLIMNDGEPLVFETFAEFGDVTKIECFDTIILKYDDFSGFREK